MYGRMAELSLRLEHRHNDGSWSTLQRAHHDAAEHDPERGWVKGETIYSCVTCDEQVRITTDDEPADERSRR